MKPSEFFALAALKRETVEVNGSVITVREMSVAERSKFLSIVEDNAALAPAYLVQTCTINEDGSQVFAEGDAAALAASSPHVVDKVATAVMRVSRVGEDDSPNA